MDYSNYIPLFIPLFALLTIFIIVTILISLSVFFLRFSNDNKLKYLDDYYYFNDYSIMVSKKRIMITYKGNIIINRKNYGLCLLVFDNNNNISNVFDGNNILSFNLDKFKNINNYIFVTNRFTKYDMPIIEKMINDGANNIPYFKKYKNGFNSNENYFTLEKIQDTIINYIFVKNNNNIYEKTQETEIYYPEINNENTFCVNNFYNIYPTYPYRFFQESQLSNYENDDKNIRCALEAMTDNNHVYILSNYDCSTISRNEYENLYKRRISCNDIYNSTNIMKVTSFNIKK